MIAGAETDHAAGVPGKELCAVPATERRISAGGPAARAHATCPLDDGEPLSGPTVDPDIHDVLFCAELSSSRRRPAGGGTRAVPGRTCSNHRSLRLVCTNWRRPRSGDATWETPFRPWLKP